MELLKLISDISNSAKKSGNLLTLETRCETHSDKIEYIIRRLQSENYKKTNKPLNIANSNNPFLPYEETLFVKKLTRTHLLILNKFNVVDNHLLIITEKFEDQESKLSVQDFLAIKLVMIEIKGLGFYNSGSAAGASQSHRHLQFAPTPLAPVGPPIPIDSIMKRGCGNNLSKVDQLPYNNRGCLLPPPETKNWEQLLYELYNEAINALDLKTMRKLKPYNLLMTNNWFLIVPRVKESYKSVNVNGLGIAGTFLVKSDQEYELIKKLGPSKILSNVCN